MYFLRKLFFVQFFNDKIHNYVLFAIIVHFNIPKLKNKQIFIQTEKAKSSHFDRTRGDKIQIFPTSVFFVFFTNIVTRLFEDEKSIIVISSVVGTLMPFGGFMDNAIKTVLYTINLGNFLFIQFCILQGLLKLLWTVYSEEKVQSCLELRNFQNPSNKDKSVGL